VEDMKDGNDVPVVVPGRLVTIDGVFRVTELKTGAGTELGTTGGTELKLGIGPNELGVGNDGGGTELKVGDGGVSVGGPGGSSIEVGPPTGPVQISPSGQHPMFPLLARVQTVPG